MIPIVKLLGSERCHMNLTKFNFIIILILLSLYVFAAPQAETWKKWEAKNDKSTMKIDHRAYQKILDKYLISNHSSGVNRFDYKSVTSEDKLKLADDPHYVMDTYDMTPADWESV